MVTALPGFQVTTQNLEMKSRMGLEVRANGCFQGVPEKRETGAAPGQENDKERE